MKRFRYTLQALLTIRERAEQTALEHYSAALARRRLAEAQLAEVDGAQTEFWNGRRERLHQPCAGALFRQWQFSDRRLAEERQSAESTVRQAEMALAESFQELLKARQERESVEKHLQRQRQEHVRATGRDEQKQLDELAQRRGLRASPVSDGRGDSSFLGSFQPAVVT